MFNVPSHKQTDPSKFPGQTVNPVGQTLDDIYCDHLLDEILADDKARADADAAIADTTPGVPRRWSVMLDMGLQYQTVYIRADSKRTATDRAERFAGRGAVAVYNQVALAADQDGPVDA